MGFFGKRPVDVELTPLEAMMIQITQNALQEVHDNICSLYLIGSFVADEVCCIADALSGEMKTYSDADAIVVSEKPLPLELIKRLRQDFFKKRSKDNPIDFLAVVLYEDLCGKKLDTVSFSLLKANKLLWCNQPESQPLPEADILNMDEQDLRKTIVRKSIGLFGSLKQYEKEKAQKQEKPETFVEMNRNMAKFIIAFGDAWFFRQGFYSSLVREKRSFVEGLIHASAETDPFLQCYIDALDYKCYAKLSGREHSLYEKWSEMLPVIEQKHFVLITSKNIINWTGFHSNPAVSLDRLTTSIQENYRTRLAELYRSDPNKPPMVDQSEDENEVYEIFWMLLPGLLYSKDEPPFDFIKLFIISIGERCLHPENGVSILTAAREQYLHGFCRKMAHFRGDDIDVVIPANSPMLPVVDGEEHAQRYCGCTIL